MRFVGHVEERIAERIKRVDGVGGSIWLNSEQRPSPHGLAKLARLAKMKTIRIEIRDQGGKTQTVIDPSQQILFVADWAIPGIDQT